MARFQHHVHKKGPDGQRTPLASCKTAAKDGRCRHEFPMDLRLTEEALVVCPGIAKKHGLRISGQRNALGSILGKRNSAWLNGTAQAFTAVFGFNSDTSPNDRLPILEETHEASCTLECIGPAASVERVARRAQYTQTQTAGYFAGYIVKAQPVGRYELKKCSDKMMMLRERIRGYSPQDQARAVSRRMITDLEMKGVLRGAPEVFNLCVNLHESDNLFQECMRTFRTTSFPGGNFLQRLELELDGVGCECVSMRIPPTRRPGITAHGCENLHPPFIKRK